MSSSVTPSEVFHVLVQAVAERRQVEIIDECYAPDVVVEHPFMVPEPMSTHGREQLRQRMAILAQLPLTMDIDDITVHVTTDPEVVVGEFRSHITALGSGRQAMTRNIVVLRVRGGLIVSSRDFHNHALIAELLSAVV